MEYFHEAISSHDGLHTASDNWVHLLLVTFCMKAVANRTFSNIARSADGVCVCMNFSSLAA